MSISFTGLASGFDSASYIDAIMAQEKLPLNRLETKKQITTAYQNVFKSLNTKLATLKDAAIALSDLGSFQMSKASTSDSTKLSATAESAAIAGEYSVVINNLAQKHVLASASYKESDPFDATALPTSLNINGKEVNITGLNLAGKTMGEALSAIAAEINKTEGVNVQASVIQTSSGMRSLVLTAKEYGTENSIVVKDSDDTKDWGFTQTQAALDAELVVNGLVITSSSNSVKDAIPGVTLTLSNTGAATVKVEQDADAITSKVEAFVKAYNDIINTIKDNTPKSTKNSDGSLSLTLQGDPMLRSLRNQLGDLMNTLFGDADDPKTAGFRLLSDIGLEVDKGVTSASLMTGTITFDKELFKEKMLQNPEEVERMFSSTATKDSDGNTTGIDGIGVLFKKVMQEWTDSVDGIITSKIKGYDSEISYLNEQIQNMSDRLDIKEASLKKKFVNLEVVMSQLNSQQDWISNQLTALTKSLSSSK
ncbi:flagellar hook-associated protein 2 [Paenibacillus barengoltzii]|uniref:flagellar filament capping protein FliD n=1 Tax=Paenibacillus barengoltzii TaxID=343517 RepID=UPI000A08A909|nr:flagellar filament capping protein FliD [Paenibacillus barengoltzii]SMF27005.1 flagellar hook-associated protein 2 [Paenibacillus barengoltzii]